MVGSQAGQGAVYVFVMPPGGWPSTATQTAELTASDGAANDQLGSSVAIAGNTVVAGAVNHEVGSVVQQGAAYLFAMPPGGWGTGTPLTVELTAADGAASDFLGRSVAVSANAVVAGAWFHTVSGHSQQGAAYVFTMPPSGWGTVTARQAELTASDGAANDQFGSSVAIASNRVVVGAPNHQVSSTTAQGAAYTFLMPSGGWPSAATQTAELTAVRSQQRPGGRVRIHGPATDGLDCLTPKRRQLHPEPGGRRVIFVPGARGCIDHCLRGAGRKRRADRHEHARPALLHRLCNRYRWRHGHPNDHLQRSVTTAESHARDAVPPPLA
jgi:hypothetical protein